MAPRRLAGLMCGGAVTVAALAVGWAALGRGWAFERELFLVRASGWGAILALAATLWASPGGRAIAWVRPGWASGHVAASRRALGLTAAALATVHGAYALRTYLADALDHVLDLSWVRAGLLGWTVLAALALTSFPSVIRVLRVKAWKPLHRLAYVAGGLALQHALLAPLTPRGWLLALAGATVAVGALRWLPRRRSPSAVEPELEGSTDAAHGGGPLV